METITENYKASILVDASLKNVYDSISRANEWWGNIEGPTQHTGDEFIYQVGDTWVKFKVAEMIPNKKIVWDVTDSHLPFVKDIKEWNGTSVVLEIKNGDGGTQVDFEHVGLAPGLECYSNCEKGWDFYFKESLKKLITDGVGNPGINPRK